MSDTRRPTNPVTRPVTDTSRPLRRHSVIAWNGRWKPAIAVAASCLLFAACGSQVDPKDVVNAGGVGKMLAEERFG